MIFTLIHRILKKAFEIAPDKEVDTCFEISSDDSDVFAGMSINSMHMTFASHDVTEKRKFTGSLFLRGHDKTATSLVNLRKGLLRDLGVDLQLQPTGKGWKFHVDMIALYYALERNTALLYLPIRHRAVSATCANFAIMGNDYIPPFYGFTYSDFLKVFSSDMFKSLATHNDGECCSPVRLGKFSKFDGLGGHPNEAPSLNLQGCQNIISIMLMSSKKTRAQLQRTHPGNTLRDIIMKEKTDMNKYIAAAALLGGEEHSIPDPIAILLRISGANFIFQQWNINSYQDIITPPINVELDRTPWVISTNDCTFNYDMRWIFTTDLKRVSKVNRKYEWNPQLRKKLIDNGFGMILSSNQTVTDSTLWTFDVHEEIVRVIENKGYYPIRKVEAKDVVPMMQTDSVESLMNLVGKYDLNETSRFFEVSHNLVEVFTMTLTAHSGYKIKGYPKLVTNTAKKVSKGYKVNGSPSEELSVVEDECVNWLDLKMKDILGKLGTSEHPNATKFLMKLSTHVLQNNPQIQDIPNDSREMESENDDVDLTTMSSDSDDSDEDNDDSDEDNDDDDVGDAGNEDGCLV